MTLAIVALPNRDALMQAAADGIASALRTGLASRGNACAALSGGTTPGPAYERLANLPLDWPRISFALVDERCVQPSDAASNEGLLRRTLAPALALGARVLPMFDGSASPETADKAYAALHLDIAIMGMGADGHTASWFPGGDGLEAALGGPRTVVAVRAPQAEGAAQRLTLTRAAIVGADRVVLLITGQAKRDRLEAALSEPAAKAPVAALFSNPERQPEVLWAA